MFVLFLNSEKCMWQKSEVYIFRVRIQRKFGSKLIEEDDELHKYYPKESWYILTSDDTDFKAKINERESIS